MYIVQFKNKFKIIVDISFDYDTMVTSTTQTEIQNEQTIIKHINRNTFWSQI